MMKNKAKFVLYRTADLAPIKTYTYQKAAHNALEPGLSVTDIDTYNDIRANGATKMVRNLMTGEMIEIPRDTPRSCDPSTELYWSM